MLTSEKDKKGRDMERERVKEQRYVCVCDCASILNLIFLHRLRGWMLPAIQSSKWSEPLTTVELFQWNGRASFNSESGPDIDHLLLWNVIHCSYFAISLAFWFRCCYDIMPSESNPFARSNARKSCIDFIWKKKPKIQFGMFHIYLQAKFETNQCFLPLVARSKSCYRRILIYGKLYLS